MLDRHRLHSFHYIDKEKFKIAIDAVKDTLNHDYLELCGLSLIKDDWHGGRIRFRNVRDLMRAIFVNTHHAFGKARSYYELDIGICRNDKAIAQGYIDGESRYAITTDDQADAISTVDFLQILDKAVPMACPREGKFIGWKTAKHLLSGYPCIVKLEIPEDAKRSSGFYEKCRCSKAKVLAMYLITPEDTTEVYNGVWSAYVNVFGGRKKLHYQTDEEISSEGFDDDRWHICSDGLHFFMTAEEAVDYMFDAPLAPLNRGKASILDSIEWYENMKEDEGL